MQGHFISIEGGDGAGKTTQIQLLIDRLREAGHDILLTREPGGTAISEKIRALILDPSHMEMQGMTEALLYAAARAQLVGEVIRPAIREGRTVICDRFVDSSVVYQGYARGLGMEEVEAINSHAIGGMYPDLTILLDLEPRDGLARKRSQKELDRMELEAGHFHEKVAEGFRLLAERHPERFFRVDAAQDIETVHNTVMKEMRRRFGYGKDENGPRHHT